MDDAEWGTARGHAEAMEVDLLIARLGHRATRAELKGLVTARELRSAVDAGSILRVGHGRYASPFVDEGRRAAHRLNGAASYGSAALIHGCKVRTAPAQPTVTVPRNRRVRPAAVKGYAVHWGPLSAAEREHGVTDPLWTVLDCARAYPFADGLAVADQAVRHQRVGVEQLQRAASRLRGPGSGRAIQVAAAADGRAFNPLESSLRAIALRVPGLNVVPQYTIRGEGFRFDADLADPELRLVLEAEGYETHGTRAAFKSDCFRFTTYAAQGWTSGRFAYEHVMFEEDWVEASLRALVDALLARFGVQLDTQCPPGATPTTLQDSGQGPHRTPIARPPERLAGRRGLRERGWPA